MATLTLAGSGTPIEDEYRRVSDAIARCTYHDVAFDAGLYPPAAITSAREMWRVRMRAEYESVPVFVDLARELAEANATLDAQAVVLRMAIDEVRHAEESAGARFERSAEWRSPRCRNRPSQAAARRHLRSRRACAPERSLRELHD